MFVIQLKFKLTYNKFVDLELISKPSSKYIKLNKSIFFLFYFKSINKSAYYMTQSHT